MKAIANQYSVSLLLSAALLASGFKSLAGDQEPGGEKKKSYTKSYAVSATDKISIDNQFGDMKISTWDKGEVKVDVSITARSDDDQRAQEILDEISIEDGKNSDGVYFKTKMIESKNRSRGGKHSNEGFNIDYTVHVPSRNSLDITNQFGPITIGDYNGQKLEVTSKFGSFTAGKLVNVKNINVQFGQANIASISDGDLNIQFSRAIISNLAGKVDAKFQHCSGIKLVVDNELKDLSIKNSFTQLYLDLDKGLSADFDITTHFCEVKNKSNVDIKQEEENDRHGPNFDHRYYGKTGSANVPVKIKSEFGEVMVGHNISFELKEDNSKKGKTSVRI